MAIKREPLYNNYSLIKGAHTHTLHRLRALIDTVLLRALSTNHTHLVLTYSHLAVGGAYIPASNQSSLLAFIRLQNTSIGLEIGGEGAGSPNVTVTIDGGEGGVQVQQALLLKRYYTV